MNGRVRDAVFDAKVALLFRKDADALRRMSATDRLPPEQLQQLQDQRTLDIARFAFERSPFYREHYGSAGIRADDFRSAEVLTVLPPLEKSHIREHAAQIRTDLATPKRSRAVYTGGSTGEPLTILHDQEADHRAISWRQFGWWGVRPQDNVVHVWRDARKGKAELIHQIKWWPSRSTQLDADKINEQSVRALMARWAKIRPELILGYTAAMHEFAGFLSRLDLDFRSPTAVGVTASGVTSEQKRFMSDVFGCPVYDHYRAVEVPFIAGECERQEGLHIMADVRRVEILDDSDRPAPADREGDVVITDLLNRVFPIVRYRVGDRTTLAKDACSCGRTLPMLNPISGRKDDCVRLPNGDIIAWAVSLNSLFLKDPQAVRQYQIEQLADYSLTVRWVAGRTPNAEDWVRKAAAELDRRMGSAVPIRLEQVDDIPHDRGKVRVVKSHVATR